MQVKKLSVLAGLTALALTTASTCAPTAHALDPMSLQDQIGSFELTGTVGRDWIPEVTSGDSVVQDVYVGLSGTRSLRVSDNSSTGIVTVRRARTKAIPGRRYHAQGFANHKSGTAGAQSLSMEFYDSTGKVVASHSSDVAQTPAGVWTRANVEGTAPSSATQMSLVLRSKAGSTSVVNWDGVTYVNSAIPNIGFEMPSTSTAMVPNWTLSGNAKVVAGNGSPRGVRLTDTSSTASTWIQSIRLPAWGGVGMKASIAYKRLTAGPGSLGVLWYDEAGNQLGSTLWFMPDCAIGTWCKLERTAQAPAKATRALVRVGTSTAQSSTIDVDDVTLMPATATRPPSSTTTSLGEPLSFANTDASTMMAVNGAPKLATVAAGSPARFEVVDLKTNTLDANIPLPAGVTRVFGLTTDTNDRVYLGTNTKTVYRWTPGTTTLETVGTAPGSQVFTLTASPDGRTIYGGTYDPAGGKVFKVDAATKAMTVLTPTPFAQDYVRSVAADSTHVYAGLGTDVPALYSIPIGGGTPVNLGRPSGVTMTTGTITSLDVYQSGSRRYLNMRVPGSPQLQTYDITRRSWSVPWYIQLEAHVSPSKRRMFLTSTAQVHRYDDTKDGLVPGGRPGIQPGRDSVVLEDVNLDGTAGTWLLTYDPNARQVRAIKPGLSAAGTTAEVPTKTFPVTLAALPQKIKRMAMGPGANNPSLYMGGFGGSSLAIRDTVTGLNIVQPQNADENFGELEGFGGNGKYAFLGSYVSSVIYRYDTTQPWKLGTNPVRVADFAAQGQDRPVAWATSGSRTYFGTVPGYGKLGGGLGILTSPTATPTLVRNVVQDQSITSLAAAGNIVYGGTSRWGGLGTTPTATSAVAFAYDTSTGKKKWTFTPPAESGVAAQAVTMVYRPESQRLFAVVGDKIFELNISTGAEIGRVNLTVGGLQDPKTSTWLGTAVAESAGLMFLRASGGIWAVDPDSLMVQKVPGTDAAGNLLAAVDNKLYYAQDAKLFQVTTTR